MALINIWRIPILFFISGLVLGLSISNKKALPLIKHRSKRILIPLCFGVLFICPINAYFAMKFYQTKVFYLPNPGHLWFLINIYVYILMFVVGYLLLKKYLILFFSYLNQSIGKYPWVLFLFSIPFALEPWLLKPELYEMYAYSIHGFILGVLCFGFGFLFGNTGNRLWGALRKMKFLFLSLALTLYLTRLFYFKLEPPISFQLGLETYFWILALVGIFSSYFNKPSKALHYLSQSVFPIYIIHLPLQYLFSSYLVTLDLSPYIQLLLLLLSTFTSCFICYEVFIRHNKWLRPLFGMKPSSI